MSININKYRFQERVENFFVPMAVNVNKFRDSFTIDNGKEYLLKRDLEKDSLDFYFKGLLSLTQALHEAKNLRYSWATVKLYYSLFYFLRASLAIKGIGFFRKDRDLLRIEVRVGNGFQRCMENGRIANSDHKATLGLFIELYGRNNVDILQSNQIEYLNSYQWLVNKREWVNYKSRVFMEPDCPPFWSDSDKYIRKNRFVNILTDYFNDTSLMYCFQPENACLALPIQRFLYTKKDVSSIWHDKVLSTGQRKVIQSFKLDKIINQKLLD